MGWIDALQWPAMVVTVVAAWLLASQRKFKRNWAFWFFHRETHFTTDLGGVLEFYPSKRTVVRFEGGDTILRFGPHYEPDPITFRQLVKQPSRITHNLQITAGVGFRFGSPADSNPAPTSKRTSDDVSRFEVGVHFTSMSRNPPAFTCSEVCFSSGDDGPLTEPGPGFQTHLQCPSKHWP